MKSTFFNTVQKTIRIRNLNRKVEQVYIDWIKRFILFHNKRHPQELGASDMVLFLQALSSDPKVAAAGVKQALNALLFMYREVLQRPYDHLEIDSSSRLQSF